ncbi:hypothetical protein SERLA73DRAFT_83119 [Serpula lacrymans var. lacrymans S7.3]|uniref:tRNA (uracil-O(2)-)-methyltransferase n=2 Tax=Serpula lacrymans var. lacrymans TaxID=341189 RepID=F8PIZ2_SERL3|nr:uncharacterized protein SERLADRAFT_444859 [Serpula lacrymans var. lacrymans S7.9]EGO03153.1 hypothetical protein SERLA73DRAFT_83119 [Serpula lacrymans var. lacrymans S7.3]EGO28938.1 hypothetical protein SERLADRAFT_444859 [Serpula lacrymans var. lacrymans S7.9]
MKNPIPQTTPSTRPRFSPSPCGSKELDESYAPLKSIKDKDNWLPLLRCPADFPLELFETAISQLIHHPEYNSTLILRSETVAEASADDITFPSSLPYFKGLHSIRVVHRKLLPRRPGRDAGLEQYCTLYAFSDGDSADIPSTLVLSPIVPEGGTLPYYHPTVFHLALRYIPSTSSTQPNLSIEVVPFPDTPTDLNSRLYRTCLALLDTLHRYGWGALTNYRKRVLHDCLVPRDAYQDLYLVMRERHKHIVQEWKEVTDPLKHVFEDIGIATFLMLLWKDTFEGAPHAVTSSSDGSEDPPWKIWPRPPGGFVDLGCGNGLLTHILISEGYQGNGIDVRARMSWEHYPKDTSDSLHVHALDPTTLSATPDADDLGMNMDPYLKHGAFIIGNHADELTPWLPVLATLTQSSGYLSIPCCAWSFDSRYTRSAPTEYTDPKGGLSDADFIDRLNLGGDGSNASSYSMYRIWLARLSQWCGWKIECETLRIPSTRNWAIIGRTRITMGEDQDRRTLQRTHDIINNVRQKGLFKTRKPEGKAGEH